MVASFGQYQPSGQARERSHDADRGQGAAHAARRCLDPCRRERWLRGALGEDSQRGECRGAQVGSAGPEFGEHDVGECRSQVRVVFMHRIFRSWGWWPRTKALDGQPARTAWMSSSTSRCVPTRERPSSTAWFQFIRKSSRLSRAVAVKPARTPPQGSGRLPR